MVRYLDIYKYSASECETEQMRHTKIRLRLKLDNVLLYGHNE